MSDVVGPQVHEPGPGEPIDLSVLERIEGELDAVERALEQIDQGVYEGFAGIGEVAHAAHVPEAHATPTSPEPGSADAAMSEDEGPTAYI
ncbi:MAG: hypothetical protein ACO1PW_08385 [Actinomycetota bacterium]